jgi:tripeptide aminopeptidase
MIDDALIAHVLDLLVAIQQIPAPPFGEAQRAAFLQERFQMEGLQDVGLDAVGNVYARLPGAGKCLPLVVSAHLDTVFPFDTDLKVRREEDRIFGPGIGDNSLGLAGLFGLLWALRPKQGESLALPGDIWLVANVGEEGLGDLRGMREVVKRFGDQVQAYIILEGMALGQVYHRALGVRRYRITAHTQGGHSWVDYGRPSAIHELAKLVTRLLALPVPENPRSSLNVGVIAGGTSVNTIAAEAHLELDLRSEGSEALLDLTRQVDELVAASERPGVWFTHELIGQRPAGKIPANHQLVKLARQALAAQGLEANLAIGSTDANIPLSQGLPAITIGLSTGHGAHTANEYVQTQPLVKGLAQVVSVVEGAFR